jgi:hypothetical protein
MRTNSDLGAFVLKPYGNQDIHYYYILGDLPVNEAGYNFDNGTYDPETGILSYTFSEVEGLDENEMTTYNLPVYLEQYYLLEGGGHGLVFISEIVLEGTINNKKRKLTTETSTIKQPIKVGWPAALTTSADTSDKIPAYYLRTSQFYSETHPDCAFIVALVRTQTGVSKLLGMEQDTNDTTLIHCSPTERNEGDLGVTSSDFIVASNMMKIGINQFSKIQYGAEEVMDLVPICM